MRNISWCPCLNTRLNFYLRIIYATYFTVWTTTTYTSTPLFLMQDVDMTCDNVTCRIKAVVVSSSLGQIAAQIWCYDKDQDTARRSVSVAWQSSSIFTRSRGPFGVFIMSEVTRDVKWLFSTSTLPTPLPRNRIASLCFALSAFIR